MDVIDAEYLWMVARLVAALVAGALIGLERTYRGRPAGFRTHALVCLASAVLMEATNHELALIGEAPADAVRVDPLRIAQGIMTGIGFLGAGAIFKGGFTVRGLTTAASIWVTAALGILFGAGMFYTAVTGAVLTLATLSVLRKIEDRMSPELYSDQHIQFAKGRTMPDAELRRLVAGAGFTILTVEYAQNSHGLFEYRIVAKTMDGDAARRLAETLSATPDVVEFRITPSNK